MFESHDLPAYEATASSDEEEYEYSEEMSDDIPF